MAAMDGTVQKLLSETRDLIGKPYRFWHPDLDFSEVEYMDPGTAPDDPPGLNCTSLYNWVLCKKFGIAPPGGTSDWGEVVSSVFLASRLTKRALSERFATHQFA